MAKATQKQIAVGFNLLSLIPSLVKLAELLHSGNGAAKKAAVLDAASSILAIGGQAMAANNPAYKDAIGTVVDATVSQLNASGSMPTP